MQILHLTYDNHTYEVWLYPPDNIDRVFVDAGTDTAEMFDVLSLDQPLLDQILIAAAIKQLSK